jgi:hypothetical protein
VLGVEAEVAVRVVRAAADAVGDGAGVGPFLDLRDAVAHLFEQLAVQLRRFASGKISSERFVGSTTTTAPPFAPVYSIWPTSCSIFECTYVSDACALESTSTIVFVSTTRMSGCRIPSGHGTASSTMNAAFARSLVR